MSGDCEEPDVLRRRIQEQNKLIELLRHRNAQLTERLKQPPTPPGRTPRGTRDAQQIRLQEATDQLALLRRRFDVLSQNHDELTKIKDEYKTRSRALEAENARLRQENDRLFCSELARRQGEADALRAQLADSEQRQRSTSARLERAEQQRRELGQQLERALSAGAEAESALERRCLELAGRQRLQTERGARLAASCRALRQRLDAQEAASGQWRRQAEQRCARLSALAADRGRQVQQRGEQVSRLRDDLAALQRRLAQLERQAQATQLQALRDAEVRRLTQQTAALRAEYDAYKKHAAYLLQQERSLNEKLRHFHVSGTVQEPRD